MRMDPRPDKQGKVYQGDAFEKESGEFKEWLALQHHANQAWSSGVDLHTHAAPSQAEILFKEFQAKKKLAAQQQKVSVATKYMAKGRPHHPDQDVDQGQPSSRSSPSAALEDTTHTMPAELAALGVASESYVEYDRRGRLIKGAEATVRSKYEEDLHPGNHTSVWGSYWKGGRWGFACCHGLVHGGYCTGEAGIAAEREKDEAMAANMRRREEELELARAKAKAEAEGRAKGGGGVGEDGSTKNDGGRKGKGGGGEMWGGGGEGWREQMEKELDQEKLRAALAKEEARLRRDAGDEEGQGGGRDRPSNNKRRDRAGGGYDRDTEVMTAEDMEAYRMKKARADDPMNQMGAAGGGELLE